MAAAELPKGPAKEQADRLDAVFGPEYFQHGRLLLTVARDIKGIQRVAQKLRLRLDELGPSIEVIYEYVKRDLWEKLHDATANVGHCKGPEVSEFRVTTIPEGIRVSPYQREQLPALEVLFLWEDARNVTRGHCLYSVACPDCPSAEQVDDIFAVIEPYFAKRWLEVRLSMTEGSLGENCVDDQSAQRSSPKQVGAGIEVTVLACHPYGFALEQADGVTPSVRQCRPLVFKGISDETGRAKICFLPAEVNKIQVNDAPGFYGTETMLPKSNLCSRADGVTTCVDVELTMKASCVLTVHVFAMPRNMPTSNEADGIVDWSLEEREPLPESTVEVTQFKDSPPITLKSRDGNRTFVAEDGMLPEGCVTLVISSPGYEIEEKPIMLLVGMNEIYVPLRALSN